jgi:TonB family protein
MQTPLLWILVFSPVMVAAQQASTSTPDIVATHPATLHERLSRSCELIQPVTLNQYKQYDALALAAATDEIYSPELRKGDFVALSITVPKNVAKSVKKSGFDVRAEATEGLGVSAKPMTNGSSCPDSARAATEANNRRHERRVDLQARLHRVGIDALPPVPIEQAQPELQTGNLKVKNGTVTLRMTVGIDGRVHDAHVVRSLEPALDQKAIEVVQQWKFSPARMNGLPIPVEIFGEVAFQLH